MRVSRAWLQRYFETELPSTAELADALTFHAFEIESFDKDMLEVKVLPDRACYALSHRGIARELSAILSIPMKTDPLKEALPAWKGTESLAIDIEPSYVLRHTGALVRGVAVGPSPDWLKSSLEAIGQRSINNIVDATNYVMNNIGQPMHAFDAGKITTDNGVLRIDIRSAKEGEKVKVLTGEEYTLTSQMFVIANKTGEALDIAGLKGGFHTGVTESTTDLFISVGNYNGSAIRKMAQTLKLFTDASARYQNRPSPELTAYGMREILALITDIAGGTIEGVIDIYPTPSPANVVSLSFDAINKTLGTQWSSEEIEGVFNRLGFAYTKEADIYSVTPPFERCDITIPEDVIEEVGRIIGYDRIEPAYLSGKDVSLDQRRFSGVERIKDFLVERGFVEISTPAFATSGAIELANPLQADKPWLREDLGTNMQEALARAVLVAPRVLGPHDSVRLFEIGNVFTADGERTRLAFGYLPLKGKRGEVLEQTLDTLVTDFKLSGAGSDTVVEIDLLDETLVLLGEGYKPRNISLKKFKPFSQYPFALRDIAVWTPHNHQSDDVGDTSIEQSEVENIIMKEAGDLLARIDLFDRFEKEERVSYAFSLVFESFEKTLSDEDLQPVMERVTSALNAMDGWQVR